MPIQAKTPQEIMKEYSEIMDIQDATGLRYNEDWLRSSMQSLLFYVMENDMSKEEIDALIKSI